MNKNYFISFFKTKNLDLVKYTLVYKNTNGACKYTLANYLTNTAVLYVTNRTNKTHFDHFINVLETNLAKIHHLNYLIQNAFNINFTNRTILFFGENLNWKVLYSSRSNKYKFNKEQKQIIFYLKQINDKFSLSNLIMKFLFEQTNNYLIELFKQTAKHYQIFFNDVVVKKMGKGIWAKASYRNKIIYLSPYLIQLPKFMINYVFVHELCHLTYPNHQKPFWNLVSYYLVDCVVIKKAMTKYVKPFLFL